MSEAKHTPGPWFHVQDGYGGDMNIEAGKKENAGYEKVVVGGCGCCSSPFGADDKEECLANARLIAAAPDMLEVLHTARDYLSDCASGALRYACGDFVCPKMISDDLNRINAAIAKATGADNA